MSPWELPTSLDIGGRKYVIRSDYRAILDILISQNDPELDSEGKAVVLLEIFYPDLETIPPEDLKEALDKAIEFIDCGQKDDGGRHPRLMDWEKDAPLLIPAINRVAGTEIRALPYMHWWTFWGSYMEIGDCLFSSIVQIRGKKANGKKLEKHENAFYAENKSLIDLPAKLTEEEKRQKESIEKWL